MVSAPNRLRLLGTVELTLDGAPVALGQSRLEELVALLALRPGTPLKRAEIAYHFWPDSSERQARTNVRNLLHKLKKGWPGLEATLAIGHGDVTWRHDATLTVDVQEFVRAAEHAEQRDLPAERALLLAGAVDCYAGDFLPACFADWALAEREQLRTRYGELLEALIDALLERRELEEALRRARQLCDHDPLHEAAYRRLMQIHALRGDRAAALRTYHACASILRKELGVEPSPATQQLHAQLLRHESTPAPETPQPVQRPRLVGRHAEWQQLQKAWSGAQGGAAQVILIWGEAGIGKTRLAEEMLDWVGRQGHGCASARSYAARGALAYAPVAEWLRAARVRPVLERVDDLWRVELARLLPELVQDRPDLPPPGPLTENWQQQRFFQAVAEGVKATARPLLLHLDDMQWSDEETLHLLHFLLHGARRHPLLLIGTIRTEDAGTNAPLAELAAALRHAGQLTEMTLGPLSRDETVALAEQTAGATLAAERAAALYTASEGHPLFLVETVQGGLEDVLVQTGPGSLAGSSSPMSGVSHIPPKIYNLIAARLAQLSPPAQQVASTAAVIGREFTYAVLAAALSVDELVLVDALDELWERRLVREQAGDSYDFSHDRIREVAYLQTSRARRRLLHRAVAGAIETLHADDLDAVAGQLAAHYAQAGDDARAFRYYRQAANLALAQHALADVERMLEAALAHAPDDPAVHLELRHALNLTFRYTLRLSDWHANLDQQRTVLAAYPAPQPSLELEVALDHCEYFRGIGAGEDAIHTATRAVEWANALDDDEARAAAYLQLAESHWSVSHMVDAERYFDRSAKLAHRAGAKLLEATSLELQVQTGMFSGMSSGTIAGRLQRAFTLAEQVGDYHRMASLLNKFGYLPMSAGMGGLATAEVDYRRGLALAHAGGDRGMEEMILANLGVLYTYRGDYRQALDSLDAALSIGAETAGYWRYWVALHYKGKCLLHMGRLDEASAVLATAVEKLGQIGNHHFEVMARCDLGLLHHLTGNQEQAGVELALVRELAGQHDDQRYRAWANTRLGYVLEAQGDVAGARKHYARGHELHARMGQQFYALNALAGTARLAVQGGDSATALTHAGTIWETLAGQEPDATVETARTLYTCYAILRAAGDPRASAVVEAAFDQLRARAATIDDPEHVDRFWRLDDHRLTAQAFAETTGR